MTQTLTEAPVRKIAGIRQDVLDGLPLVQRASIEAIRLLISRHADSFIALNGLDAIPSHVSSACSAPTATGAVLVASFTGEIYVVARSGQVRANVDVQTKLYPQNDYSLASVPKAEGTEG